MNFRKCDKKTEILECSSCECGSFYIIKNNETNSMTIVCAHCGDDSITFGAGMSMREVGQMLK